MGQRAPRPRGTGNLFKQKGSRVWWIKYYRGGHRYRESTHTTERRKAVHFLQRRLAEIYRGDFYGPATERIRARDLLDDILRDYRINRRRSLDKVEYRWRTHLEPFFGHLRIVDITTEHLNRYVDKRLQEGAANASVNRELAVLRRMFHLGAKQTPPKVWRIPVFPHLKEGNVRTGFVNDEQYATLVKVCRELWQRALLAIGYNYGWRGSEIRELRVRQVDMLERTIRLDPFTTKNDQGRLVPMVNEVYTLLCECCRGKNENDYVLTRDDGGPVKSFRTWWETVTKNVGLPGLRFHDLRRSAARNLRKAGVAEKVIMEMCGWKTRSVFDRYNIISQSDLQEAARRMEERSRQSRGKKFGRSLGHSLGHSEHRKEPFSNSKSVRIKHVPGWRNGRREGLKIPWPERAVWVRPPPRALSFLAVSHDSDLGLTLQNLSALSLLCPFSLWGSR